MRSFLLAFIFAAQGIAKAVKQERNLRLHICVAVYALYFSRFYHLSAVEYAIFGLTIAGVMAFELLNSSLERMVDALIPEKNGAAKTVKDMAAGAVLLFCAGALFCGLFLFWDIETFLLIYRYFSADLLCAALLLLSIGLTVWFVFFFGERKGKDGDQD